MVQHYLKLFNLQNQLRSFTLKHICSASIKPKYIVRHISLVHSNFGSNYRVKLLKSKYVCNSKLVATEIYSSPSANTYTRQSFIQNQMQNGSDNQYKRLFRIVRPEFLSISAAIMLLAISSSVTLSVPFFMGKLIDIVQEASESGGLEETLQPLLLLLSSIFFLGALANAGRIYLLQMSGQRVTKRLRESVFSSILSQELAFFDKTRTGELISRLAADVELVSGAVTQNVSDGIRAVAQVTVGIGMMFYMSSDLAKIILMVVPPVALASVIYGRYLRFLTSKTQGILAESSQHAEEKISSIRTVRSFSKEYNEIELYIQKMNDILDVAKKEAIARSGFFGLTGLSGNAIMLLVLYNGGLMMQAGQISVGDLSAFLLYSGYVAISISGLSSFYSAVNKSLGASQRLWELIDRVPAIPLNKGVLPEENVLSNDIHFNQVQFAYPSRKNQNIFDNLDLKIESGKVTAIVGQSGCGKTTLGSLLLRFYEPNRGNITIGDVDLSSINPQWIRNQIGTVFQEPTLFSASIQENIAYGAINPKSIPCEKIIESAKKANAYDFINELPKGFNTEVGERGITLSGGQRQRIAIARALLKNPKILLLDEATSALDATSEYLVKDALEKLYVGRTTIIIAHRLSTIRDAHMIVVLGQNGKVKESGTYNELININNGYFKELVEKQTLHS